MLALCGKKRIITSNLTTRELKEIGDKRWAELCAPDAEDDEPLLKETRKRMIEQMQEMCQLGFM